MHRIRHRGEFEEAGEPAVKALFEAVQKDPRTAGKHLLLTLEVGKIEAEHQDYNKPRIFLKKFDNVGLIEEVSVNPRYGRTIPLPKNEFSDEELGKINFLLGTTEPLVIEVMLSCNLIEKAMIEALPEVEDPEDVLEATPPILCEFNKRGFPIRWQLNWPIEREDVG